MTTENNSKPDTEDRQQMDDWAYAAVLVGIAFALVLLLLGMSFLIDVFVKGWPS